MNASAQRYDASFAGLGPQQLVDVVGVRNDGIQEGKDDITDACRLNMKCKVSTPLPF